MITYLQFPEKQAQYYTRISLREYSRPRPNAPVRTTLSHSIVLPLPQTLQDSINVEVANPALDILGNDPSQVMTAGRDYAKEYADMAKSGNFSIAQALELATRSAALAPGISDSGIGRLAQSIEGVVRNPHLTTIFEGVRLKTYDFTWKLSPQSESEASKLNEIILTLRRLMLPRISGGGFSLDYPFLAEVEFPNLNSAVVPTVKSSFITGMTVNGGGTGILSFYADGQPVTVDLTLAFQEINIQTRDDVVSPGQVSGSRQEVTTASETPITDNYLVPGRT